MSKELSIYEINKIEELFKQYRGLMHHVARSVLTDSGHVEDAVSESFEKIIRNIDKIGDVIHPQTRAFVVTIVKNTAINIYKKNVRMKTEPEDEIDEILDDGLSVEDEVVYKEQVKTIRNYVDSLPASLREVLILSLFNEYSNKEISEILGVNYETVKKRAYRARMQLANKLNLMNK